MKRTVEKVTQSAMNLTPASVIRLPDKSIDAKLGLHRTRFLKPHSSSSCELSADAAPGDEIAGWDMWSAKMLEVSPFKTDDKVFKSSSAMSRYDSVRCTPAHGRVSGRWGKVARNVNCKCEVTNHLM